MVENQVQTRRSGWAINVSVASAAVVRPCRISRSLPGVDPLVVRAAAGRAAGHSRAPVQFITAFWLVSA